MKIRRLICAALAASLALCPAAFAADTPKTDRIVTTQNGTGYSVSSVGRHIIPVSDSSQSFDFSPLDGYDLSTLIISDGKYTDRANVVHLDGDLKLNGVTYPVHYQSRTDAGGESVIRATVDIPAASDDVTLSAEAVSTAFAVTATSQTGATVSAATTTLNKGDAYSMTATPDRLYSIVSADLTIGGSKSTVQLSKGCDVTSNGFRFRVDAAGVLAVYSGGVTSATTIELKTAERQPDNDEVLITVRTGRGLSSDISRDIVKKGSNYNVSFSAKRGYTVDALTLSADGKTAYSTPNTNTVFVGTNAYRVSGNSDGCTVYLTDLQSNITVSAESSYDTDHLTVDTSAGSGVRIRKDCGSTVDNGADIEFEIYVTDDDRYELDEVTLRLDDSSRTVDADATSIRVAGKTCKMETDSDGVLHLYVNDVDKPVSVSATAKRIDTSHSITIKSASHLTISKDISGSSVRDGKDVAFTVKPSSGYAVDDITLKIGTKSNTVSAGASYIRVNGVDYNMTRNSNGNVTVYVDSIKNNVTISATAVKSSSVVKPTTGNGANGKIYIDRSVKTPFFVGYNSRFHPKQNLTRAEAVQLLARMTNASGSKYTNSSGFSDVQVNSYYSNALSAFVYGGIVDSSTYFNPNAAITRADFVEMIYRLDTTSDYNGSNRFTDVYSTAPNAAAIAYCSDRGWVRGDPSGTFRPYDYITRAEAAAVVNRTMGRTLSSTDVSGIRYTDVPMNFWAYNDILIASGNQR